MFHEAGAGLDWTGSTTLIIGKQLLEKEGCDEICLILSAPSTGGMYSMP